MSQVDQHGAKKPDQATLTSDTRLTAALSIHQSGRFDQAEAMYREILQRQPQNADAMQLLATLAAQTGRATIAIALFDEVLKVHPYHAGSFNNRGSALRDIGHQQEALESYEHALRIEPAYAEAFNNRGNALRDLDCLLGALDSYNRALGIKPDYFEPLKSRGAILRALSRPQEALASYDRALIIEPGNAEAINNRGNALLDLMRHGEALQNYDRALRLRPNYAEAHWNNSLCRLLAGDFARGWPEHEWRFRNKELGIKERRLSQPLWLGGEPLAGRTILLHSEQGLGDTIQFCRYATQVAQLGARVILEVQPPLTTLLRNLPGVAAVVSSGEDLPDFDCHCPLPSLPLALKVDLDNISNLPYLSSDAQKVAAWREKLTPGNRKRIGLAWSGSKEHSNDLNRSIALSQFMVLLDPRADYYCLQKELRPDDQAVLQQSASVRFFGNELADFSDTAALVDLMDLVITVDTSLAHLAGALGKRVWILLPYRPDWRWLLGRSDSPWYRSARLFRQAAIGDWGSVLAEVKTALGDV